MPFTPSGQETDWAYSIITVPGTHMGPLTWTNKLQVKQVHQQDTNLPYKGCTPPGGGGRVGTACDLHF